MRGAPIRYSDSELNWIKAHSDLPRRDLHALFILVWNRPEVTADNIKSLCSRMGWAAGPEGRRRTAGKSLVFSVAETAWLKANATLSRNQVAAAFATAFGRTDVTAGQIIGWRKRNQVKTGRTGRFPKGNAPPNKGRKGYVAPGSEKGWFSKGRAPHNARPIGYETVNSYGYVLICVHRPNPFRPDQPTHMAFKHRELWEAQNGPMPKGHALKCLDGNKLNCDPANWEAIPKGLLPRLNGKSRRDYDHAPAEVKPTIMAVAKLEHAAQQAMKARDHAQKGAKHD
jgi:hypothetical protein